MTRQFNTIVRDLTYPEGPRWHDGRFWFVDFYTFRVISVTEDGRDFRLEAEVPHQPSGLGWLPDGRLLVVSMKNGQVLRRESDGSLVVHADVSSYISGHLNDMVVSKEGRAYVGNFGFDLMSGKNIEPTCLLRIDPDGTTSVAADDLRFPNGSVITDDGVLLVAETFGNRITAFDISADGSLTNRRVWASFGPLSDPDLEKALGQLSIGPDGCCLDAKGALWVADVLGKRLLRVKEGGEILEEIDTGAGVFACTLGGAEGRTLFVCSAPDHQEDLRKNNLDGSIVTIQVDVPRAGLP